MCVSCRTSLLELADLPGRRSSRDLLTHAATLVVAAAAPPIAAAAPAAARAATTADLIFHGGTVVTANDAQPEAEALAVRDGRIVAVGSAAEIAALAGPDTRVIDLQGKTVLPGFIDSHLHVVNTAFVSTWVDVSPFAVSSLDEVLAKLGQAVQAATPGVWVTAFGYDPSLIPPNESLTIQMLDGVSTASPIFVMNLSGHLAYANSPAFQRAGVTNQTPDVAGGGRYVKDANGQLTGEIAEPPALAPFLAKLPSPSPQQMLELVQQTLWQFQRAGCTTVNDNGMGLNGLSDFALLAALATAPSAPLRISGFPIEQMLAEVDGYLQTPSSAPAEFPKGLQAVTTASGARVYRLPGDNFQLTGIKIWQDGSAQGLTAALRQPYLNSTSTGFPNYTQEQLTDRVQGVHDAGWMCSIHCNGDAAVEAALNAFETALTKSPRPDHRHRIDHCTVTEPRQIERIARLGLTPSFLINHIYYWGDVFKDAILGAPRAERLDPAGECVRLGVPFSLHCDAFTTPCAPLSYIQTAVTRKTRDSGQVLGADLRISVEDAIKAVTLWPAHQLFQEDEKGSLEPGKLADLVVLAKDPRRVPPDEIAAIEVVETWLGGEQRQAPAS
jgi:predicted amidohydrolase YtcJ